VPAIDAQARYVVDHLPESVQAVFRKASPAPTTVRAETPFAEQVVALATAAGMSEHAGFFATDPTINAIADAQAAIARAREIKAVCVVADVPELASQHIRQHTEIAAVKAALNAEIVRRDEATVVNTAAPSKTLQSQAPKVYNPGAIWASIHKNRSQK